MPSRHSSRERAVQILYQLDMRKQEVDEAIAAFYGTLSSSDEHPANLEEQDAFMEELVRGTVSQLADIDLLIAGHSANWRIERMPAVDRNILRCAVYEMRYLGTPAPVAIDEALELARRFSGDDSVAFVNGVLDAVSKSTTIRAKESDSV